MSLCLALACGISNQLDAKFCAKCGTRLLIQDRYRALKIIGQGGFGKTLLAQDEGKPSQPKCVIKQFTYAGVGMQKASELFKQEAEQLEKLGKHAQIPELLAHTEQEGRQYLVQEFIEGQNIAQELVEQGAFNETKIREFLLDLLPVLQFLHTHQVIHRDIKPENIIRRRSDKKLLLVDFGAAKQATLTALAKTGTMIGSPEYTAPEQARGKPVFASDIYSLGVTCLNLLTLCSPFDLQDSDGAWVWRDFLNETKVSPRLGEVLDKSIAPLSKRYSSATAMLEVLNPSKPSSPNPQVITLQLSVRAQVAIPSGKTLNLDCGNEVNLELVEIPAGEFMMGAAADEKDALFHKHVSTFSKEHYPEFDECPQHQVRLNSFFMGKYAVTQAQWKAVMGKKNLWQSITGNNPSYFKGNKLPVENVSWNDATEFCIRLSQMTGKKVRLPSEAEWEYACRSGTTTPFSFGENITTDQVNYNGKNSYMNRVKEKCRGKTLDVDSFSPNDWGLYQMHGNIREWCEDLYHRDYKGAPVDGSAWIVDGHRGGERILRGGGFNFFGYGCRSASRNDSVLLDGKYKSIGFRVIVSSL
jgi:formylglycine-generating enzyme required for sulfatase activity/predicted Ser/Thr protein kinase